jgi:hypothetical protein
MGTAPKYDWPAILDEVCEWLAAGGTIRSYSRQEGKPAHEVIFRHVAKDEAVQSRIVRARAEGADAIAEEAFGILDECSGDAAKAQACKVRFDGRMRLLSKWNSGRYGDKAQVEHSGKVTLDSIIAETLAKNAPPKAD